MREEWKGLSAYIETIERLKKLDDQQALLKPIATGKWSVLDILCHIWLWDEYILKEMLPKIRTGEAAYFPGHESVNSQVRFYTESKEPAELLQTLIDTRFRLIAGFEAYLDTGVASFAVGTKVCSPTSFLDSYIVKHDLHHIRQIEACLGLSLPPNVADL